MQHNLICRDEATQCLIFKTVPKSAAEDLLTLIDMVMVPPVSHWLSGALKFQWKAATKRRNRQRNGGKITLLPHASSASCLGIISNAGAGWWGGGREGGRHNETKEGDTHGRTEKGDANDTGNVNVHTSFFFLLFFLFGQTQDDESQVFRERRRAEDRDGATLTTCLLLRMGSGGPQLCS